MRIDAMLAERRPIFSFEFFPPDTPEGDERLFKVIERLRSDCHPDFVSVTCRNHSRHRTVELVSRIKNEVGLEPMAHFTCVGATRDELNDALGRLRDAGIDNVLALRGDPPAGGAPWAPAPNGLHHAAELASLIRDGYDVAIGGACHPEVHVEATSAADDLRHCRAKVDAGCGFLITQLFFDNRAYFSFVERARAAGITVPIIPGIMPITSIGQLGRFAGTMFGATIPEALRDALLRREGDADSVVQLGAAYATLQCAELLAGGAPGIHFYTLNRSPSTRAVLSALLAARPWERTGQTVGVPGGSP